MGSAVTDAFSAKTSGDRSKSNLKSAELGFASMNSVKIQ
jgi:hypothetical protein